ncbi:class I SAM-dependent methyltransferase family protein [Halorutilales archaeon Cl-col2-1]
MSEDITRTSACVKVDVEKGETTRQTLGEADAVDGDLRLRTEDGSLYIPVESRDVVPESLDAEMCEAEFEERESLVSPEDILGYSPTFETVGDIALIEEKEDGEVDTVTEKVGEAVVEADNNIKTALAVESKVKGRERLRDLRHVYGDETTETVHREYGVELRVNVSEVYFTPRLANERQRVVSQIEEGERVLDMFAGVGPYSVPAAKRGAEVTAVDVNPDAVEYLRQNAERNGVGDRISVVEGDAREVARRLGGFDRIIMNLPHSANDFLDEAVEAAGDGCVIHYYDMRHEDDLFEGAVDEIREAASDGGYEIEVLDEVNVRSYAPYEYNVCIDARLKEEENES